MDRVDFSKIDKIKDTKAIFLVTRYVKNMSQFKKNYDQFD